MLKSVKTYITDRFIELRLTDNSVPFNPGNIFFYEMERDYLKDNDYAALTFFPQDRKKQDGSLFKSERDLEASTIIYTRKSFKRTLLARILIYSAADELEKLCNDLEQSIAENRNTKDDDNNNVKVKLQDLVRPWDSDRKEDRLRRRSYCAIAKIEFEGGIYTKKTVPLIKGLADITIKNT